MKIKKSKAIREIIRENNTNNGQGFSRPSAVFNLFRFIAKNQYDETDDYKEKFWVIGLNRKNKLIYIELVSLGTLTASIVSPREVYRTAIIKKCASIICCHNHPSGDTEPSGEDMDITRKLKDSGDILGVQMLDHVIIGDEQYSSIFELHSEFQG